jgi:glucokinase
VLINDVDAGVYGELRFGAARRARCVVGVFAGTGIGGGAVYEGSILRGRRGSCLKIGHIPVLRAGLCAAVVAAAAWRRWQHGSAIAADVAKAALRGEAPYVMRTAGGDVAAIRSRVLADAIEAGDHVVEAIVREAARTIGWATAGVIAPCCCMLFKTSTNTARPSPRNCARLPSRAVSLAARRHLQPT